MKNMNQSNNRNKNNKSNNKMKNIDIIGNMLQPEKIIKNGNNNKDVEDNYKLRKNVQRQAKKGKIGIEITNAPYKNIIKDKIPNKKVDEIEEKDLIVHTVIRGTGGDDDLSIFNAELEIKKEEDNKINDELKIEFDIENYDKHKKKFDYKETFIKNLAFEQNTFDESKEDYIEFYKQKQKEAEDGLKLCDKVLENFIDEGFISKNELPLEKIQIENEGEFDLKSIMANVLTDKIYDFSNDKKETTMKKSIEKTAEKISNKIPNITNSTTIENPPNKTKIKLKSSKKIINSLTDQSAKIENVNSTVKKSMQPITKTSNISSQKETTTSIKPNVPLTKLTTQTINSTISSKPKSTTIKVKVPVSELEILKKQYEANNSILTTPVNSQKNGIKKIINV